MTRILEDFLGDVERKDVASQDVHAEDASVGAYETNLTFYNVRIEEFQTYFSPSQIVYHHPEKAASFANKVRIVENSTRLISNVRISAVYVEDNNFVEYPFDEPEIYSKINKSSRLLRFFKITFDVNGDTRNIETLMKATCELWKFTETLFYKVFAFNMERIWRLSKYIGESDKNMFNGTMYRDIVSGRSLSGLFVDYMKAFMEDTYGIKTKNIDVLRASKGNIDDRVSAILIQAGGMSRQKAAKFRIDYFNESDLLRITLKNGETVSIDNYSLKEICLKKGYKNVEFIVDGTLVIQTLSGYENLNVIKSTAENNTLMISGRVSPRILDWIMSHLWFNRLDLSHAKTYGQKIAIYKKDKGFRNKDIEIIPSCDIEIKDEP